MAMKEIEDIASKFGFKLDSIQLPEGENCGIFSDDKVEDVFQEENQKFDNIIVVGNLPLVAEDDDIRFQKLNAAVSKIFRQISPVNVFWIPVNPATRMSLGYCFIECDTQEVAKIAKERTHGYKLGPYTFAVNLFDDFDRFMDMPDHWTPPPNAPAQEVELSQQRHAADLIEKERLSRMMSNKEIFQKRVVSHRQEEFNNRLRREREKPETELMRKLKYYSKVEEERRKKLHEEEQARERQEAERKKKEQAEHQAKLDVIAEKQMQRLREIEDVMVMKEIEDKASKLGIDLDSIHLPQGENCGIFSDDEVEDVFHEENLKFYTGFGNIIVVDNLPLIAEDDAIRFQKLNAVVSRIFGGISPVNVFWIPVNPATRMSLGYCFIEYDTREVAQIAKERTHGSKLGPYTFAVNMFDDFVRFMDVPDHWTPPNAPAQEVELSQQRHALDLFEKERLSRMIGNKEIFQKKVVSHRQAEFIRLSIEKEERISRILLARKQEREKIRKLKNFLKVEKERKQKLCEEEEARERDGQAKLDGIAEKQRQRLREIEEKTKRKRREALLADLLNELPSLYELKTLTKKRSNTIQSPLS